MTFLNDRRYYLTAEYPCSYLGGRNARSEVALGRGGFDELIRAGFRRSGHFVYRPCCRFCKACVAVRIDTRAFAPNRSQRRSVQRHCRLEAVERMREFDPEHFELYCRYQDARHPSGGMGSEEQYRQSLMQSQARTLIYEFRDEGSLMMVSVIDEIVDGLSSVYTFFEPGLRGAGLGTYNIMWQIDLCRKMNLPYLYLGYWIAESEKMAYKIKFRPLEGFVGGAWRPLR